LRDQQCQLLVFLLVEERGTQDLCTFHLFKQAHGTHSARRVAYQDGGSLLLVARSVNRFHKHLVAHTRHRMKLHAKEVEFVTETNNMLSQAVTGTAIQRTVQAALHQAGKGDRASALFKQAQQQAIFGRGTVKPLAIDEQQAMALTVLHDVSRDSGQLAQLKMFN
jgi:hypothetical protein